MKKQYIIPAIKVVDMIEPLCLTYSGGDATNGQVLAPEFDEIDYYDDDIELTM